MRWRLRSIAAAIPLLVISFYGFVPVSAQTNDLTEQFNRLPGGSEARSPRDEADRLVQLGLQQRAASQFEQAIDSWQQALIIYQLLQDFQTIGRVSDYIGLTYAALDHFAEAEDALRQRLAVARDNQDFQGQIYGLNNLGTILLRRGNLDGAEALFLEAGEIARSIDHPGGQGLSLSNLGLVTVQSGDYETAIKQFEVALALRRRAGDLAGEANTLNNLGDAYQAVNRLQDALRVYLAALRVSRDLDRSNQFRAIDGLVAVYSATGQYSLIGELLGERLRLAQAQSDLRQQLTTIRLIAEFYRETDNLPQAQAYYQQAIGLARQLEDPRQEALLLSELANLGQ
jgi:tetratricopeptide (TPR) repeat protein